MEAVVSHGKCNLKEIWSPVHNGSVWDPDTTYAGTQGKNIALSGIQLLYGKKIFLYQENQVVKFSPSQLSIETEKAEKMLIWVRSIWDGDGF